MPPPRTPKSASAAAAGGGGVLGLLSALDKENGKTQPDGDGDTVFRPMAVKRVVDVFDNPQFFIDGPTANDVRQGRDGDCWLMAALCTLSNKPGLIERCCVEHNQEVGVYGFVFHRDGEWFSEIIDDKVNHPSRLKTGACGLLTSCSCISRNLTTMSRSLSEFCGRIATV